MCNRDKSCSWRFGLSLKIGPGQTLLKINDPYMMEMMIRTQRMEPTKVPFVQTVDKSEKTGFADSLFLYN